MDFFLSRALQQPLPANIRFPSYNEFRACARRQRFSLPDSIIHYLIKNIDSSASYIKLIKCCKYFFIKNPIIPVKCLHHVDDEWKTGSKSSEDGLESRCVPVRHLNSLDVEKVRAKFIVHCHLDISSPNPTIAASLIPKLYRCRFTSFCLVNQKILFDDFLCISQELTVCELKSCTVVDEHDKEVPYEMIISNLPNIKDFSVDRRGLDSSYDFTNTAKELLKIPHFKDIDRVEFCGLSEAFDVEYLLQKKEKSPCMALKYYDVLSDEYKAKLQEIVDGIIDEHPAGERLPSLLFFPGQHQLQYRKLFMLHFISEIKLLKLK